MKTKLIPILFVLILTIIMLSGVVSAITMEQCNDDGGIYCDIGCRMPGFYGDETCIVSDEQIIYLDQGSEVPPIQSNWTFDILNLSDGAGIHFFNTGAKQVISSTNPHGTACHDDDAENTWGVARIDDYASAKAGNGGAGGDCNSGRCDSGAGGAGGSGGVQFVRGSYGSQGGWGCEREGNRPGPSTAGYAGANIKLIANVIEFSSIHGEYHSLSVSGGYSSDGGSDTQGHTNDGEGGHGGAGGAGGSGAGKLELVADYIRGEGKITATGSNAGSGGSGSNGKGDENAGGGGGAGSAGMCGEVLIYANNYDEQLDILIENGENGEPGGSHNNEGEQGKPAETIPECLFGETITLSEVEDGYFACHDDEDNDLDGFTDFEDADCWPEDPVIIEDIETSFESNVDVEGPISLSDFDGAVGAQSFSDKPWWNPFALDGSDGICGDDFEQGCLPLHECDVDDCNEEHCILNVGPYVECEGYGTIKCSDFEEYDGKCNATAPDFCVEEIVCLDTGFDPNCPQDIFRCEGIGHCSDFETEESCLSVPSHCDAIYETSTCSQRAPCTSMTEQEVCESEGNSPFCYWLEGADQTYVNPNDGDEDENDGDQRYFCNNDYLEGNEDVPFIEKPGNTKTEWNWWDAFAQANAFKIHQGEQAEFISNGEQWFVCNATGDVSSNAIGIEKHSTFKGASNNGEFLCTSVLNSLSGYFQEYCPDQFSEGKGWQGYFEDWVDNLSNNYYCMRDGNDLASSSLQYFFDGGGECLDLCGWEGSEPVGEPSGQLPPNGPLGNLLDSCEPEILFEDYYCTYYPCSDDGVVGGDFTPGEPDGLLGVESCGYNLESCLGLSTAGSDYCDPDIHGQEEAIFFFDPEIGIDLVYQGFLCRDDAYTGDYSCLNGDYAYPNEITDNESDTYQKTCCIGKAQEGIDAVCNKLTNPDPTQLECEAAGGHYLPEGFSLDQYYCAPAGIAPVRGDCCYGSGWEKLTPEDSFGSITQNTSFICYEQSGNNLLGECCTDFTVCNNAEEGSPLSSLFSYGRNEVEKGFYKKGGVLHTLQNFDDEGLGGQTAEELEPYVNYFAKITPWDFSSSEDNYEIEFYSPNDQIREEPNWTTFDYLEFDVVYNAFSIARGTNDLKLFLVTEKEDDKITCDISLLPYLTNGKSELRWHHAVIPIEDITSTCADLTKESFERAYFRVESQVANNAEVTVVIGVDNFYLSENSSEELENSPNYYCSGNFATWITNLDGETPEGWDAKTDSFNDYGPYMYACEAQASFDWTGGRCCGDQTKNPDFMNSNLGEYFNDYFAGCFHGTTVYHNLRVGDALNEPQLNNLLFYDGAFLACQDDLVGDQKKRISYDAQTHKEHLVNQEVGVGILPPFTVRGDYVCDQSGFWINKDDYSVARLIAAKMYNISSKKDTFTIYCESADEITNESYVNMGLHDAKEYIKDICVLQFFNGEDPHSLVGIGFSEVDVNVFLNKTYGHIRGLHEGEAPTSYLTACEEFSAGSSENNDFFKLCLDNMDEIGILYNPDFKILLMTQDIDDHTTYLDGLFKEDTNFIQDFWNALVNLFRGWFGFGDASGDDIEWTENTVLPLFSNATTSYAENLEGYLEGTPISGKVISMQKLFIKRDGYKQINAFKEHIDAYGDEEDGSEFITLEYLGFNTSVKFLAEQYFSDDKFELQYARSENGQIVQLVNPKSHGDNLEGEAKTFEPSFTWQRLGPLLYFSDEHATNKITKEPGNGIVDMGEWCDNGPDGIVYKFRNNDCDFWGNYEPGNNVTCNIGSNTLNYNNCVARCTNGDMRQCGTNEGVCEVGEEICIGGIWMNCDATFGEHSESGFCDNELDDDCDGLIDMADPNCNDMQT